MIHVYDSLIPCIFNIFINTECFWEYPSCDFFSSYGNVLNQLMPVISLSWSLKVLSGSAHKVQIGLSVWILVVDRRVQLAFYLFFALQQFLFKQCIF